MARPRRGGRCAGWRLLVVLAIVGAGVAACPSAPALSPAARAAGDSGRVILIDDTARSALASVLPPVWMRELARRYTVRTLRPPAWRRLLDPESFRITPAALRGVDLLILGGFDNPRARPPLPGLPLVDLDFTPNELAVIEGFVRGGGTLMILSRPTLGYPNNLPELLARFGVGYEARGERLMREVEAPRLPATAALGGRRYRLGLATWADSLAAAPDGSERLTELDGRPLLASVRAGSGRLLWVGSPDPFSLGWTDKPAGTALEHGAFIHDLIAHALGLPPLTEAEAHQATWALRVAVLEALYYPESYSRGGARRRPVHALWAEELLASAPYGLRCFEAGRCKLWQATPEQISLLERIAAEQAATWRRYLALEQTLRIGPARPRDPPGPPPTAPDVVDYAAVERDYRDVVASLAADPGRLHEFNLLYAAQGGTFPGFDPELAQQPADMEAPMPVSLLLLVPVGGGLAWATFRLTRLVERRFGARPGRAGR